TFDVAQDLGDAGPPDYGVTYDARFVAYDPAEPRGDVSAGSSAGTILHTETGNAPNNGEYRTVSFDYTPTSPADDAVIGKDLGIRFRGGHSSGLIDNVRVMSFDASLDINPPVIAGLYPPDDATNASPVGLFVVTFDEDIVAGTGRVTIKNLTDTNTHATIDVTDGTQIGISGRDLIINPTLDLDLAKEYAIHIDETAIEDSRGIFNYFTGIDDDTTWNFTTLPALDTNPPAINTLVPADDATDVFGSDDLVITFDEQVLVGTGFVTIRNISDATQLTIDIADSSQVMFSGPVVTIDPTADLSMGKDYAVRLSTGAIRDTSLNNFPGIVDDTTWNFSTTTANLLLLDGFESPASVDAADSSGNTAGILPNNGKWVGATSGFGANRRGIIDKSSGHFDDADPNQQAFAFRYTNSGLTSGQGVVANLTAGTTYTISFDVVQDLGRNNGTPYTAEFVAFTAGEGNAARADVRGGSKPGTILTGVSGNALDAAPAFSALQTVSFNFTPMSPAHDALLGQDLGLRFIGSTTSANIDNVLITSVSTPDTTTPMVVSFDPADESIDVSVDANLIVTFDKDIVAGAG
ncbi:MAG: Ig-like domain-containing protein, partial [Verrucomicrobiota bacterium]